MQLSSKAAKPLSFHIMHPFWAYSELGFCNLDDNLNNSLEATSPGLLASRPLFSHSSPDSFPTLHHSSCSPWSALSTVSQTPSCLQHRTPQYSLGPSWRRPSCGVRCNGRTEVDKGGELRGPNFLHMPPTPPWWSQLTSRGKSAWLTSTVGWQ